ncbi:hypothetical protein RN001_013224 [Aquatica leii]|uniref:CIP2A N-terminal domain-containing protein n=1 Tax=Aquatica leii TaxID=1421715 RepID=A0AAN7NZT0_9COLE|nr:hypothetical protein RN001_013224 [Aquatica leii]
MKAKESKMSATLEGSGVTTNDKYYNMKQFINTVRDYVQTRAEDSANLLNRHLQLISVTIDLSAFDPHTNVVAEFFVSLYELLSIIESGSLLAWCCVNVLSAACKNSAARMALINTYQFLPLLSRLLGNQLTTEKKVRLLTLMQELTCGIKISWQIPHLPHLMSTLTRWIEHAEEKIVTLSLAVLVNLCYKNLPAVYTLSRCVDIKKFVHLCIPLKGLKIEVHVCKLLIILDYMNGKVPEGAFLKLIGVTFKSLIEAFKARDSILLRHIVEFFLDMWDHNNHGGVLQNFDNYDSEIDNLISELENTSQGGDGDLFLDNGAECMTLAFAFLHFIIKLRRPNLPGLDSRLVNLALNWIQVDFVSSDALAILRTVAVNATEETCIILNPFLNSLPLLLLSITNGEEEIPTHIENNKRLCSLMELLRALMKAEITRRRVLTILKEDVFMKIFMPLIGCSSPRTRASNMNTSSAEAILLYVNSIALIHELLTYDEYWIGFFTDLMQHKQIHMILAQALYNGSKEIKTLILRMSPVPNFPINEISSAMCELHPLLQADSTIQNDDNSQIDNNLCFPMMSVTQVERLDEIMNKMKEAYEQNNLMNISTSDVMELYEYKLATMSHAERAALASVEAASLRCTHLQHRTAQLTAELSRLHQLLLHTQQCHEETLKAKDEFVLKSNQLQEWLDLERNKYNTQLTIKEKCINEKTQTLENTMKLLREIEKEKNSLEEKNLELKRVVTKLENNLTKKETLLEINEELLVKANKDIDRLREVVSQLEKQVKRSESELAARMRELTEVSKDLHNCKSILGTITQLTKSQYPKHM